MSRRSKDLSDDQLEDALDIFQSESDRACAVLGAAHLEFLLGKAIIKTMPQGEEIAQDLICTPNAPLGTFSSRIDAAYGLGIINAETRADLHTIRDVRNDFAHDLEVHSFERNDSVRDRCSNLKYGTRLARSFPKSHRSNLLKPRNLFISTVVQLHDELRVLAGIVGRKHDRVLMVKKSEENTI